MLAQTQQTLLGALRTRQGVVLRAADGAKQDRVRTFTDVQGGLGQRIACGIETGTAHQGGFHADAQTQGLDDPNRLRGNFRADAISGQNCNLHLQGFLNQ